ncbi:hypothetical protein ILUMI_05721 [Ignelater luminosus]|uniref:Uncharacterized protein n=1 Tax=Ignelater luminosus TaxID=2038154 RepID=A0A8K0D9Y8_IGNLU|nr:hypothetical protein ILUMI_05721 [Ignelater luminosus]
MSSSSSNSSDSEESTPVKGQKVKSGTSKQSSSSDSDFVNRKEAKPGSSKKSETAKDKSKHLSHQSTPLQDNAMTSSKLMFQKMLMGSNNKLAELLKNKQSVAAKNKDVSPSPVKGILKTSNKSKSNDAEIEFDPIASSTQIKEVSMSETPTDKAKRIKQKAKDYVSETESSSDENVSKTPRNNLKKDKKKHQKEIPTVTSKKQKFAQNSTSGDSSDSEDETQIEKVKAKQDPKKFKKVQKDSSSSSSSSDELSSNKHNPSKDLNDFSDNESENRKNKLKAKDRNQNDSFQSESDLNPGSNKKDKKNKKHRKTSSSESESESDVEKNLSAPSKLTSQFEKFESYHKGIKRINEEHNLLGNIKSNDEIFLVQIPKKLEPKSLIGTRISLTETTRVPGDSRKYDCIPSQKPQKDPVAIFTNTEKIHLIKSAGNIKIQKHIKSKNIPDLSDMWINPVTSFPENLKQRHPLFGADYSDKVNLEEHVQAKLKAAIESYAKQKKKKKKHKKKEMDVSQEEQQEEIFKFLNQTDSSAKHVKIKKEADSEKNFKGWKAKIKKEIESEKSSEELETKLKKKKKKKEKSESIESEGQIEEFSTKKKKNKKHKKHSYDDELDGSLKNEEPKSSKKQKSDTVEYNSSKKIKKENSEDAMQLINEMLLSKSMEISASKEKKKRKHSHSIVEDAHEENKNSDLETKKKKHKKEHKTL